MAWPLTPLTTYTANFAPAIKAFDLNAFQSAINNIVGGTYSLKGVSSDGAGGVVIVPVDGSLLASRTVFSNAVPSPSTIQAGEFCRDNAIAAAARFEGTGAGVNLLSGYGIHAKSRVGAGQYLITLQRVPTANSTSNVVCMTSAQAPAGAAQWGCSTLDGANRPEVLVTLEAALDYEFTLIAMVF